VLDGVLGRSRNLLGESFTVADLNVASILAWAQPAQIEMSAFPKLAEWLKNCAERASARAARQMQRE
jgi:glutathione S-transferase